MNISSSEMDRLDYLDATRAFALILGIIFHASLSFTPIYMGWAIMDISTSSAVSLFMMTSHSFRLALFFLIAGFFGHMTLQRRGPSQFLKSRLIRIAIPFVVGWFLLRPLLVSGWIMGAESLRGDVNILAAVFAGFATLGELPTGLFVGTHLWFLYYLLLISFSVALVHSLLCQHKFFNGKLIQLVDAFLHWLCESRFDFILLALPTGAALWFMDHWGLDTPDKTLIPDAPVSLIYCGFFIFGWLLHRQAHLIDAFARLTWARFILCIIAIISANWLAGFGMQFAHPYYLLLKAAFAFCYALMMWSLVALCIGLFRRYCDRASKTVRYLADSSYWLYLIHLPLVIWLQIAFAELPLHWLLKLIAICTITIAFSLALYDLWVRPTFIGAVLNGKRKARIGWQLISHLMERTVQDN